MKREELIAMGISEENVEKIIADYGKVTQKANADIAALREKAGKADDLQTAQMSCRKSWMKWKQETSRNLKKQTRR